MPTSINANDLSVNAKTLTGGDSSLNHSIFVVRRSLLVRFLKAVVASARNAAPPWLYSAFSRVGFAGWKGALRLLYGGKVLSAWLRGDRDGFEMYRAIRYSLLGSSGLEATYKAVAELLLDDITGCIVECGVAEGGSSALMATVVARHNREKTTWLFDSCPAQTKFLKENPLPEGARFSPVTLP